MTICDHCALPVERVIINNREWWGHPKLHYHLIYCTERMGRHTVNGVPLGERVAS